MTRILGVLGLLVVLYGALIESNPAASSRARSSFMAKAVNAATRNVDVAGSPRSSRSASTPAGAACS